MKSNKKLLLKKNTKILLLVLLLSTAIYAQSTVIPVWENAIPNAKIDSTYQEFHEVENDRVGKVYIPTLTAFYPKNPNGTAVIICPGGGYKFLAIKKEGYDVATYLNTFGITAFVLKYRLPDDAITENKEIGPLQDIQAAIRFLRKNASTFKIDVSKIGVMGFSAGGHLAATASTKSDFRSYETNDSISAKPDFSVLIYPVISMQTNITHKGSRRNLLGANPTNDLINDFSTELQINSTTPPAFLVHALDDKAVVYNNSLEYFTNLKKHNIKSEILLYESGGHGFGLGKTGTSKNWPNQLILWLTEHQFIK